METSTTSISALADELGADLGDVLAVVGQLVEIDGEEEVIAAPGSKIRYTNAAGHWDDISDLVLTAPAAEAVREEFSTPAH